MGFSQKVEIQFYLSSAAADQDKHTFMSTKAVSLLQTAPQAKASTVQKLVALALAMTTGFIYVDEFNHPVRQSAALE